jgi:hypothetical protein
MRQATFGSTQWTRSVTSGRLSKGELCESDLPISIATALCCSLWWCFRNRLLVIDLQLLLAKSLAAHFDLTGSCEAKFGYNLFLSKALSRFHQQLITEAPGGSLPEEG